MKAVYAVKRVAFVLTGGDIPHAHAHVHPMHEKTDTTSGQYILNLGEARFGSDHLITDRATQLRVKEKLRLE